MAYKIMGITSSPFYTNMMIYYIMCDTPSDLPSTISDIGYGTTIGYGSRADIISDSSKYLWNGSQWVRQTTGGGGGGASSADQVSYDNTDSGLTATNVQDAIDELKDTDDTQDNTLTELYGMDANQQLEINYAINTGAKNMLKVIPTTQTINGVTFTVNNDQTITVNGTNTGTSTALFVIDDISLPSGIAYTLSGCPSGGSTATYYIGSLDTTNWQEFTVDTGNGGTATLNESKTIRFRIGVRSGVTVNNLVFKPMLRRAEITDSTYVPYAPTNRELYETEQRQDAEIGVVAALGAKNLFRNEKNAGATVVKQGATWIFDQTSVIVKVSGTVSTTWSDVFLLNANFDLSDKEYTIVVESDSPDLFAYIPGNILSGGNIPTNGQYYAGVYKYKGIMTTSTRFTAKSGSYADNTIKFMICPAEITDTTFEPYAPTNRELYEMILALQSGQSTNRLTQSLNSPLTLNREELTSLETDEIRETEEIEETNETEETE